MDRIIKHLEEKLSSENIHVHKENNTSNNDSLASSTRGYLYMKIIDPIEMSETNNKPQENMVLLNNSIPDEAMLGRLLPLTCGHNGRPKPAEMELLDRFFKESGLI